MHQATTGFKSVVILTYQRCGSSFLGNLFNFDNNAYYIFEPLDSLYSSLYGITPGWNVPSDISTLPNGKSRLIPPREQTAIAQFLRHLFVCDVNKLPTDTLVHPFFHVRRLEMTAIADYEACLNDVGVTATTVLACYKRLHGLCSLRFGSHGPSIEERCHRMLHQLNNPVDPSDRRRVENFTNCMTSHRKRVDDRCAPILESICSSRTLRVVKVVRASMESMEHLLRILPESKVIHLVRDPRAVALSRWNYNPSGRGHYSSAVRNTTERLAREAFIYCRRVVDDVRWRVRLEKQFPGRLFALSYEELVNDPIKRAVDVYRFIGESDVQESVFQNFSHLAKTGSRNLTAVKLASSWRRQLKPAVLKLINERCNEMIELYPQYANIDIIHRDQSDPEDR